MSGAALALAGVVGDPALSDELLRACRRLGLRRQDRQEDGDGGSDLGG